MASDVDVIRCAVPWPGMAAQLLEGLANLGDGVWSAESICAAAAAGLDPGDATAVLAGLAAAGVCVRPDDGADWRSPLAAIELQRLAQMLRGADHFRRLRTDASSSEFVVTMPMACVFHAIVGTDSTARWARIPREGGQPFHGMVGAPDLKG